MKKTLSIIIVFVLIVALCAFAACNPWKTPGDKPGGGKDGQIAEAVDASKSESVKDSVKSKSDLDDLSGKTSADGATEVAETSKTLKITDDGTYILKGSYGGISIAKNVKAHLIFNEVTVIKENDIAIEAKSGAELIITLNEGTINTVTNSGVTVDDDGNEETVNAIHSKGSLAINGKGTLNVNSESKSALKSKGELQIVDATLNLSAVNHAITGASVAAANCSITVASAGKDGINAECEGATSFRTSDGYVTLKNVNYTCNVDGDGIQADTVVYVDGGTYNVTTNGTFVTDTTANRTAYGLTADDFKYVKSGNDYKRIASDDRTSSTKYALTQGCKGIKVGEIEYADDNGNTVVVSDGDYLIYIAGGTFNINSTDDAIHANSGNVLITGGTYTISTYDDGITSDVLTKITGGNITITKCYEGIEGAYVEISGNNTIIDLVSSDDGINAASDDRSVKPHIIISGGNITVDASGDGIDSNGSILISGGTVTVHGPTTGGDAGLDADNGIVITGGTVFVTSMLGMVETPSTNSTQYVVSYAHQSTISAGSVVSLRDSSGNVLITVTVKKKCQSIIMSCAALKKGSTYSVYGGSTQMTSFTVSSIITTVGSLGSNFPGGPGGGGRPGGR
ncbi:MAG: carbohydrate-binding domain-containing protein [Clostridiales bacterium]|nr:carbohydrate-binding domain-containing protein [Clostridiales bacterium]